MPVVEATVVEAGADPESKTIVTKLPPTAAEAEPAPEPERQRLPSAAAAATA